MSRVLETSFGERTRTCKRRRMHTRGQGPPSDAERWPCPHDYGFACLLTIQDIRVLILRFMVDRAERRKLSLKRPRAAAG